MATNYVNKYKDADIDFDQAMTEAKLVATTFLQLGGRGDEHEILLKLNTEIADIERTLEKVKEEGAKASAETQAAIKAAQAELASVQEELSKSLQEKDQQIYALHMSIKALQESHKLQMMAFDNTKASLEQQLKAAHVAGDTTLIESLQNSIKDLDQQIAEAMSFYQASMDKKHKQIQLLQKESEDIKATLSKKMAVLQHQIVEHKTKLKELQHEIASQVEKHQKHILYLYEKVYETIEDLSASIQKGGLSHPQQFLLQFQGKDSRLVSTVTASKDRRWDASNWDRWTRIFSGKPPSQKDFLDVVLDIMKNNGWEIPDVGGQGKYKHYLGTPIRPWDGIYSINGVATVSDSQKKRLINDCDLGLDFIMSVRPVSYKFRAGADDDRHYGFLGDQVKTALKGKAFAGVSESEEGIGMIYTELLAPLVKAVQEQQDQIETLKAEIRLLRQTR